MSWPVDFPIRRGDIVAGKYRMERALGTGGMGLVVAAWHIELDERVAIKFLLPAVMDRDDAATRFRREARAAARIKSEHVVRVFDVGRTDAGIAYMVMEYLTGHDLAHELRSKRRLPQDTAIEYVLHAIDAMAQAHAAGIVHRDLKPGNLFLSRRPDGSCAVKILDFGISKSLVDGSFDDMRLTGSASTMGSPLYMPPEQLKSARDVDTRADVWSLGAILFEMLTGRPPFDADSFAELCSSLLSDSVPSPRELNPDVTPGLERVVLRCLEKDRDARFPDVAELAAGLAAIAPHVARGYAERAARMLATNTASSPSRPAPQPCPEPARAAPEATPAVEQEKTQSTWGTTRATTGRQRRVLWSAAAATFVCAALALAFRHQTPPEVAPNASVDASGDEATPVVPARRPEPTPGANTTREASAAIRTDRRGAQTAPPRAARISVGKELSSQSSAGGRAPARNGENPEPAAKPGARDQPGPHDGDGGASPFPITDFGGRR